MAATPQELLPGLGKLVRERVHPVCIEFLFPELRLKGLGLRLDLGKQRLPRFVSGPSSALDSSDLLVAEVQTVDVDSGLRSCRLRLPVEADVVGKARGESPEREEERGLHR